MSDRTFLDWPFFEPAHKALADEVENWARNVLPGLDVPHEGTNDELDAACRRMVRSLGEVGLLSLTVPAPYGGRRPSLDVRSICLAREILGRHIGLADFAFAMQGLGSAPISLFGNEAQKRAVLPEVAAGRAIAAFGLSEPDAGSDPGAMTTTARQDGDHYVLNGLKTWISNAGIADVYTIFARIGDAPGPKNLACFIVRGDTPGLDASQRIDTIAPHPLGYVRLTDCRVPAAAMIGAPGEGFKIAMATLDVFRSTVGAASLGFARRALDEALKRTRERSVFGHMLHEYQLTQAKIADMAVGVDASALLIYRAAWTKDVKGIRVTREASMAKMYATEAAQQVIDQAVQLWGGLGVVRGVTVESLYREIRALRIYEGTTEIQKLVITAKIYEEFDKT